MITLPLFVLAVATVLITPGPTNALLWTSATLVGLRRSMPLILGEVTGYLIAIGVLRIVGDPLIAAVPKFGVILRLLLVAYLLFLSWQLWRLDPSGTPSSTRVVSIGRVFLTTLLNPKSLVFAFAIFPAVAGPAAIAPYVIAFVLTVGVAATGWIAFGALINRLDNNVLPRLWPRVSAVALGVIAAIVAGSAIAAIV